MIAVFVFPSIFDSAKSNTVPQNSATRNRIFVSFKRFLAFVVVVGYLGMTTTYFCIHTLGLEKRNPMFYMWIWDMFPGYESESMRRFVVGSTADGTVVQLIPGPNDHFHWGVDNVASRIDLNRHFLVLQSSINRSLLKYQKSHPENPVDTIYIINRNWSSKYNFPDDLYEKTYGIEKKTRKYWDLREIRLVDENGTVIWGN